MPRTKRDSPISLCMESVCPVRGTNQVAGYLHAFGSRTIAYDPYFQGDPAPAVLVDLETLMKQSGVVSIHARLTEKTHHLIGRKELLLMKPSAVLVNTARSGLPVVNGIAPSLGIG